MTKIYDYIPHGAFFYMVDGNDVLATTDPVITYLPGIPSAEVTLDSIVKKHIPNGIQNIHGKGDGHAQYQAEIDVIKACIIEYATSSKRYTNEDIEKAIESAQATTNFYVEAEGSFPADVLISRNYLELYLKSLNTPKQPIKVEVEMEFWSLYKYETLPQESGQFVIKVDENNFVNVLRWIYE